MKDNIFNRIKVEIKKAYYASQRYGVESTFALIYHEKAFNVEELGLYVRISDHFIKIDDNHYFMNFAFTSQNDAFKASQNLVLYLDKHFNDRTTCIAIDTFDTTHTCQIVYNRLMEILKETKKSSYTRIEDENILNGIC